MFAMGNAASDTSRSRQSTGVPRLREVATFGLLVALASLILVASIAPDDGLGASSVQQGIAIAVIIAAVPVASLVGPIDASRVISLGGAMTIAGVATMLGGNLAGLLMAISGLAILLVGASREPPISWALVGRLVGYAALLALGMLLSVGDTTLLMKLIAVSFAVIVATSSLWDSP
jgi:hypothetical protein